MTRFNQVPQKVTVPTFELMGPSCPDCKTGVLVDYLTVGGNPEEKYYFQECSECKKEFNKVQAIQKIGEAAGILYDVFSKGVKSTTPT